MVLSRWQTVSQIFEAAIDLPPYERDNFIHEACAGNSELEAEVVRLLSADEKAGSFLEHRTLSTLPAQNRFAAPVLLSAGYVVARRFQIVRFIGQGGMGQVYEAIDLELKSRIALKVIRPEIASDPLMLSRFRREVQLTRMITHPNVCRTFDIERHAASSDGETSETSDLTFLTMELLEGETLAQALRRQGRMSAGEALPLVLQMIDALAAAHAVGVIHRDFKPSNVLLVPAAAKMVASSLGSGSLSASRLAASVPSTALRVVVTDFGLARIVASDTPPLETGAVHSPSLTGDQAWMGTLVYMAPEQFERGDASVASDVYSLGLVLFEMVTGERPFADDLPFAEAAKRLKQSAPLASTIVPDLEPAWDAVVSRCLAIEARDRFANVHELADALASPVAAGKCPSGALVLGKMEAAATTADSSAANITTSSREQPSTRSRRYFGVVAIVVLLVSLSALAFRHYLRGKASIHFAERDWILVTDFTNQTGEKLFDRVVRDLAVLSLSQSTYVNVVPRLSALEAVKRTGRNGVNVIDENLGIELCTRESYNALLTGEILKEQNRYLISMKVEVPGKESAAISDTESIQSPDEMFSAVDHIVTRLRQELGEPVSRIENNTKPLAEVTTPSIEALQRYSIAMDLYGAREYDRSINLAKDAVEQDPNFAMAHLLLGRSYEQIGNDAMAATEFEKARAGSSRASERERHVILAAQYASRLQNEEAAREYQHLLDVYPDDVDSLRNFAIATYYAGHPGRGIEAQRRALALSPNDPECYDYLMELLIRTNQFSNALSVFEQAQSRKVETSGFIFLAALAAWGNGDLVRAQRFLETPASEGSDYAEAVSKLYMGKLFAYQGRMREAIAAFNAGLGIARRPGSEDWASVFYYQLAKAEIAQGDEISAKLNARKSAQIAKTLSNAGDFGQAGRLAVDLLDWQSAIEFANLIRKQSRIHADPLSEMRLHALQGQIDLAQHHARQAILEERKALDAMKSYEPLVSLGQACEEVRDWNCSIEAYSEYLDQKGEILRNESAWDWVMANYRLARVYEAAGKRDKATEYCRRFLNVLSSSDPDLPVKVVATRNNKRWNGQAN